MRGYSHDRRKNVAVMKGQSGKRGGLNSLSDIVDAYRRTVAVKVFTMDHLKAAVRRCGKEVYPAEIDYQWAEKAVSGLKDERLTPPYIGRLVRSLAAVFHDLRHHAVCQFYEKTKLSDVQIARITGHRDPRMLLRYASLRGSDLAQALW